MIYIRVAQFLEIFEIACSQVFIAFGYRQKLLWSFFRFFRWFFVPATAPRSWKIHIFSIFAQVCDDIGAFRLWEWSMMLAGYFGTIFVDIWNHILSTQRSKRSKKTFLTIKHKLRLKISCVIAIIGRKIS